MGEHDGHWRRLRERYRQGGFTSMDDAERLELLLTYARSRGDTAPAARRLIERFGSLSGVLEAGEEELMEVEGVGRGTAMYLGLIMDTAAAYRGRTRDAGARFLTTEDMGRYLCGRYCGRKNELTLELLLDSRCRLIAEREMGEGDSFSTALSARSVVDSALKAGAAAVVLSHNHPDGTPMPSSEDIAATRSLLSALGTVDIVLRDHIIVAGDDFVSMADNGLLKDGYR